MSLIKKVCSCAALLLFVTTSVLPATNSSQVVFSKTGGVMSLVGNSTASSTPFGFWIWCNADAASTSNGGYQLDNACQGEMYFYALQVNAQHVIGKATEGAPGVYTMHVFEGTFAQFSAGTLNPSFTCSLTNVTPGGGSSVNVTCNFASVLGGGMGSATTTDTIVNITGP